MSGLQGTTLEERLTQEVQVSGVGLSRQSGLKVPRDPHRSPCPNYTWGTPGINNCGRKISWFPFGHWGYLLCDYRSPWSTFSPVHYCNGMRQMLAFQLSSKLQLDSVLFSHEFLIMTECPSHLLGRDILSKSMPLFSWIWRLLFLSHELNKM